MFDCITLKLHRFENVAAIGRNEITDNQISVLKASGIKNIKLALDPDAAGNIGLKRSAEKIMKHSGLRPYIVLLKKGNDPDEYIHLLGPEAFSTSLDYAP